MKTLMQVVLMALKDMRIFVGDRGTLAFALVFPLLFVFAFSMILPDADQDETMELHVASAETEDGISHQIIAGLTTIPDIEVIELAADDATAQFEDEDLQAYLFFPAEFSTALQAGEPVSIQIFTHGDSPQLDAFLNGIGESIARDVSIQQSAVMAAVGLAIESGQPPGQEQIAAAIDTVAQDAAAGVGVRQEEVGDIEPLPAASYVLPGYVTMFLFFAAGFGAGELIKERRDNTFDRLIASGVEPTTILAGKWLGTAFRALIQAVVLWTVGLLFFNISLGHNPAGTVLVTLAMLIASASFALFLASLVRTQQAADSAAVLAALTMAALGGSWWPLFIMPDWMQTLAKITPHAWANEAFSALMLFGANLEDVLLNIGALLLFGLVFVIFAAMRINLRA